MKKHNVVPIRPVKSYRQLWEEAGKPKGNGLEMMKDAEERGDLAKSLGYVRDDSKGDRSDT